MKKLFFTYLLLCLSISIYAQIESPEYFYKESKKYKREGNYQQAVQSLSDAIRLAPSNALYFAERGVLYFGLDKAKKARQDFDKSIAVDAKDPIGFTQRAEYFNLLRLPDSSLADCEKAIGLATIDLQKGKVMIAKANAYKLKSDTTEALKNYMEGLKLDTLNKEGFKNYASLLQSAGNEKEAIVQLKKALALDAFDIANYNNLGYLSIKTGLFQEALPYFDQVLKFDAQEPYALSNKGLALYKLENYTEALKVLNKSISNDPENAFAYRNRALVYIALNKNEPACRDLKKAKKLGYTSDYEINLNDLLAKYCQ